MEGKLVFESDREAFKPKMYRGQSFASGSSEQSVKANVVSVIPVTGVLMKDDQFCGPVGMDTIGRWIKEADGDQSVDAIMLKIDSPGGTVSGTANLAQIVANVKKPIVAFVDELAASAAYWIASQCDMVIASTKKAEVGSIGVMLQFMDVQPMWEKEGVVFHEIYADGSEDKNKDMKEIRANKYENYKKEVLNPLRDDFELAVIDGRGNKITDDTIFKGRLEFADKAITTGLVDQIATFNEAVDIALSLVDTTATATAHISKPNTAMENKHPRTVAVIGVSSLEVQDGGSFLTEEMMNAIEVALEQAEVNRVALEQHQSQASTAQEQVTEHMATIAERDATIAQLTQELAEVRQAAGAPSAIVAAKSDPEKTDGVDPMLAEVNGTTDIRERMEIMRKYGLMK